MGIDLKLLPMSIELEYIFNALCLDRRSDLWEAIRRLKPTKIGKKITVPFSEEEELEDNYGELYTYLFVKQLLKLKNLNAVKDNTNNRAAWAYLSELPEDQKILLYWC